MIKAGIVGAAGYTGGELIRILSTHPNVELAFCQSQSQAGKKISSVHRDLIDLEQNFTDAIENAEVLFFCMGHGRSRALMEQQAFDHKIRIIDLSHDFRLHNGHDFIYGLPELQRDAIKKSHRIANPGCFATSIQLALLPMANEGLIKNAVHVHGITGSTGAGQALSETTHFTWRNNNISVYKAFKHQHLAEITQSLIQLDKDFKHPIHFVPVRGDFTRGILASVYFETSMAENEIKDIYSRYYQSHPFVKIIDDNPDVKMVVNTNYCILNITVYDGIVHIISVIDNLVKGASGQAVQNMNLIFDL
ncbi:MAG: N-acetyl-gamma-glutamyl-phosphate reductase, partial [Saprospiraceae bacterium]|nr:N-acetyl-gamma-glutamyl-phosphate reductase [Saprospiraceae bacterium]